MATSGCFEAVGARVLSKADRMARLSVPHDAGVVTQGDALVKLTHE
ncbi:hypothetical protein ABIB38_000747 [Massilia sp. UYP11]